MEADNDDGAISDTPKFPKSKILLPPVFASSNAPFMCGDEDKRGDPLKDGGKLSDTVAARTLDDGERGDEEEESGAPLDELPSPRISLPSAVDANSRSESMRY